MPKVLTELTSGDTYTDYTIYDRDSAFGGPADLFGSSEITAAQLNDPTFRVLFDASGMSQSLLKVDDVYMEVFFTAPGLSQVAPPVLEVRPFVPDPYASGCVGTSAGTTLLVAVGVAGLIATSSDGGATWVERVSGVASDLWDVKFKEGVGFIVVGGRGVILRSSDGVAWTREASAVEEDLYCVAFDEVSEVTTVGGYNRNFRHVDRAGDTWGFGNEVDRLTGHIITEIA